MARLRDSGPTSLPASQQPRNPQSESIARTPYDSPTVEQPVSRLGVGERAELSRQALGGAPGDRRHDAHETVGASGIPKVGRPELGLGPITGFIEHVRSLARPPRAAGSARDMRSLA